MVSAALRRARHWTFADAEKVIVAWRQSIAAMKEREKLERGEALEPRPNWRPPNEDLVLRKAAAQVARLSEGQILVRPPLCFVYNRKTETPIKLHRGFSKPISWEVWDIPEIPTAHKDLSRYNVPRILQDIYQEMRVDGVDPPQFSACRAGKAVIRTFKKLGSLHHVHFGTCYVRKGKSYVIVDSGLRYKYLIGETFDEALQHNYDGALPPARGQRLTLAFHNPRAVWSGVSLFTVPTSAYESGSYKVVTDPRELKDEYKEYSTAMVPEDWRFDYGETSVELLPGAKGSVKVAVEIDRTLLGLHNVVFFERPENAKNADRVWERVIRLERHFGSPVGLRLRRVPTTLPVSPQTYILAPDSLEPYGEPFDDKVLLKEQIPFRWDQV